MATFTDKKKREWVLDLDVHLVEQIETRTEVRVDHLIANKWAGLESLFGDPIKFVRLLWVMVEEQAAAKAITPEDFGRGLGGDSLEDAGNAFVKALADFSPRQQRAVLTALLAKGKEIGARETDKALKEIAEYDPTAKEPDPTSSAPVTTAAGSSDSTPAPAG